jgi:hypothetical protein
MVGFNGSNGWLIVIVSLKHGLLRKYSQLQHLNISNHD